MLKRLFFGLLYFSGVWLIFRRRNRWKIPIVMYHGLVEQDADIWTQVTLRNFVEQMEFVQSKYKPIRLTHAVDILAGRVSPLHHPIVITFDDGFGSNEKLAYPVLKAKKIPATIYLATSLIEEAYSDKSTVLWSLLLQLALRRTQVTNLDLTDLGLGRFDLDTRASVAKSSSSLPARLKAMDSAEKNRLLPLIMDRLQPEVPLDPDRCFAGLSSEAIRRLASEGLIEFGAHTVHHEILTRMPLSDAEDEMTVSRTKIEEWTGKPVRHFAYPNGNRADYNMDVKQLASAQFDSIVTTVPGLNSIGCDLHDLRRLAVGHDTSLIEFKLMLSGILDFIHNLLQGN